MKARKGNVSVIHLLGTRIVDLLFKANDDPYLNTATIKNINMHDTERKKKTMLTWSKPCHSKPETKQKKTTFLFFTFRLSHSILGTFLVQKVWRFDLPFKQAKFEFRKFHRPITKTSLGSLFNRLARSLHLHEGVN